MTWIDMTGGRMGRRAARFPAVIAVLLATGLAVGGCGAGGDGTTADRSAREKGGAASAVPDARGGARPDTSAEGGKESAGRPRQPAPDYLSTFALDVDTASYGYARRTLGEGRLPDPATVRPEEFVNSFRPDYPRPADNGFSVTLDGARAGSDGWSLVRVGLATRGTDRAAERPPAALTFVVDISGSMAEPGRLDLVKESLGLLADQLRDDDSIALVTFSDEAETRLPMTRVGRPAAGSARSSTRSPRPRPPTSRRACAPDTTWPSRATGRAPPTGSCCSPTRSPTPVPPRPRRSSDASRRSAGSTGSPSSASVWAASSATRSWSSSPTGATARRRTSPPPPRPARSSSTSCPPTSNCAPATPRRRSPSTGARSRSSG